jgi:hypothetical protein
MIATRRVETNKAVNVRATYAWLCLVSYISSENWYGWIPKLCIYVIGRKEEGEVEVQVLRVAQYPFSAQICSQAFFLSSDFSWFPHIHTDIINISISAPERSRTQSKSFLV